MLIRILIFFGLSLLPVCNLQAAAFDDATELSQKLVVDVYQPLHSRFADLSDRLANNTIDLCKRRPASSVFKLQTDFTHMLEAYSAIELFRLGPLLEDNRKNRLFFWPDKRRVGQRQLRNFINSVDVATISVDQLARKSVALQGLTALERLLFTTTLFPVEKSPQCHLITVVTRNIANMALELNTGWSTDSNYVQSMLQPYAGSKHFRTSDELVSSVYSQAKVGLDVVLNAKIAPLLSDDPKLMAQSPMWLSQRSISMLTGNLRSLKALLVDSGLLANTKYQEELQFEFEYIEHVLEKLKPIVYLTNANGKLGRKNRILLNRLATVVTGITYVVNTEVANSLGVNAGFNSEDGD